MVRREIITPLAHFEFCSGQHESLAGLDRAHRWRLHNRTGLGRTEGGNMWEAVRSFRCKSEQFHRESFSLPPYPCLIDNSYPGREFSRFKKNYIYIFSLHFQRPGLHFLALESYDGAMRYNEEYDFDRDIAPNLYTIQVFIARLSYFSFLN